MQRLITFFLLFFLVIGAGAQSPKYEVRATWLTTLGGMDWPSQKARNAEGIERQKQELRAILDQLQQTNINTVLLQVRTRGAMIYPSAYEPFAESLTGDAGRNPLYDPLAFAIEECHKRGMELHAWLVTIPLGNLRQVQALGSSSVVKRQPALCKKFENAWYLDPGHPNTATYLCGLVCEIVQKYDVDGIHLDYIRYPENGSRFPDNDTYRRYGNGMEKTAWRRKNITHIVRNIYQEVKSIKAWVKVSSSPIGKFADTPRYSSRGWNAYQTVYQDAKGWLQEGIHDMIFPMMYFTNQQFYPFVLDWVEGSNQRLVVPGLGIYFMHPNEKNWNLSEIVRQIQFSRQAGAQGVAYFRNKFLLNNTKGLLRELQEHLYRTPAVVPPMTWLSTAKPPSPTQTRLQWEGNIPSLRWESGASGITVTTAVTYRLYASSTYPVDTSLAENLMATGIRETHFSPAHTDGKPYWAVTAVDRFGNESDATHF